MERNLIALLFVSILPFGVVKAHTAVPSHSWSKKEMNPLPDNAGKNDKKIRNISCGSGCKFDLHYFIGGRNAPDKTKKNILFISGGPGQIMKRVLQNGEKRFLNFLEHDYNVYYFDIRGAGFSAIGRPNRFDTALRAANVVDDIERVRKAELTDPVTKKVGAWDAVYGHSHGTIVAQIYANSSQSGSPRLNKLILSAPLSRHKDFEEARIQTLADNLRSIFENYRQHPAGEQCPTGAPPPPLAATGTDNFCFLFTGNDGMVETLINKFKQKLTELSETFGSAAFAAEYFKNIEDEEPNLVTFPSKFPYPRAFYLALQRLSLFGGTEPKPLEATDTVRQARVNAAFLLGYYLALDENEDFKPGAELDPRTRGCRSSAPFLRGVTNRAEDDAWKEAYCDRYLAAFANFMIADKSVSDSDRANIVFGLNDGINRFIFKILNVIPTPTGCIQSKDVKDFANDRQAPTHKTARALARRVGIDLNKQICAWNPRDHRHARPTLIFKGGADPIVSGGQAENVFHCSLEGERVLLDFPGVGHLMELPNVAATGATTERKTPLAAFVDAFLRQSFEQFPKDQSIKDLKEKLGATMLTASGPGNANICPS
jgi:pimeloyl-ACP methyl ester carboxylesterase